MNVDKLLELSARTVASSLGDESHSAGWKLQLFIHFHRDLSTKAMSTDSSQVGVALFSSF